MFYKKKDANEMSRWLSILWYDSQHWPAVHGETLNSVHNFFSCCCCHCLAFTECLSKTLRRNVIIIKFLYDFNSMVEMRVAEHARARERVRHGKTFVYSKYVNYQWNYLHKPRQMTYKIKLHSKLLNTFQFTATPGKLFDFIANTERTFALGQKPIQWL